MTKRSVILVGVLIVMVMVGSAVIGAFSGVASSAEANGSYSLFLPLVMKFFAALSPTDIYMGGVIPTNMLSYNPTPHINYAAPLGNTEASDDKYGLAIMSPPQGCVAKDLRAELIPGSGVTLMRGYDLVLSIGYVGGSEGVVCAIADPATSCVSSTQLTIPANSKIYIRLDSTNIYAPGEYVQIPFAWICSP